MGMRADTADSFYHYLSLNEVLLLRELLDTAMVITDKYFSVGYYLTVGDEPCVNRLFKSGMVRSNRNDIAHP